MRREEIGTAFILTLAACLCYWLAVTLYGVPDALIAARSLVAR